MFWQLNVLEQTDRASLGLMEPCWKAVKTSRGKQRRCSTSWGWGRGGGVWFWLCGVSHDSQTDVRSSGKSSKGKVKPGGQDTRGERVSGARRRVALGRRHRCYDQIPLRGLRLEKMGFRHCCATSARFHLYIHPHTLVTNEEQEGRVIFPLPYRSHLLFIGLLDCLKTKNTHTHRSET